MPSRSSRRAHAGSGRRAALAVLAAVVTALAPAACGPTEPPPTEDAAAESGAIDREAFVDIYVALLRARATASDSAAAAEARRAVLERHGVAPDVLDAFIDRHADDVEYLADVWETIRERLAAVADSVAVADSAEADAGADAQVDLFDESVPGRSGPPEIPPPPRRGPPDP